MATDRPLTRHFINRTDPMSLKEYIQNGGYTALRKALEEMTPKEVVALVADSKLRGRGGAGFSTGAKWGFVPPLDKAPAPRYLVANADEMEPGAFKDRFLIEGCPHQLLEGMLLAAYACELTEAYIFLRWAYKRAARLLDRAIQEVYQAGFLGKNIMNTGFSLELSLHQSAGRYICGEESALLNALEGKRPVPRNKPPFPPVMGLWGRPTIVQNVETLCNIPGIVERGADWYKSLAKGSDSGTKIYGVSGRVNRPGAWELPMGVSAREILMEHAGGLQPGYELKGFLPGGASTRFLTLAHLDTKMDFESVQQAGSRLGTGTLIIVDNQSCPVGAVENLIHFFAQESCGYCTPCRDGLPWVEKTLHALEQGTGIASDLETLSMHCKHLSPGHTFCAFAPGAIEPLVSALQVFRADFEQHIVDRKCPWR